MARALVGREKEAGEVEAFVREHVESGRGGSLYISGTPGTGKTATTTRLLTAMESENLFTYHHINCMNIQPPRALFAKLELMLKGDEENVSPLKKAKVGRATTVERRLGSLVTQLEIPAVVVLDEVDQLMTENPEVLYTAFSLPGKRGSRLVLLGIANGLDLTERFLPKLKLQLGPSAAQPRLLNFAPYTKDQLKAILGAAHSGLDDPATELCARKVSAADGDVRKALDIVNSVRRKRGREGAAGSAVASVLAEIRSATASPVQRARLTAQQKLLLAAALSLHTRGLKAFSFPQLHAAFKAAAAKLHLDASDPHALIDLLEAQGLLGRTLVRSSKKTPLKEPLIRLMVDEEDAFHVLNDDKLVNSVVRSIALPEPLKPTRRPLF